MRCATEDASLPRMTDRLRITILGAGFAGLETAFLLRMRLRDRADLTVISQQEAFTFRPNTIYVPFGADPADLVVDLSKPFHRRDVDFVQGTVAGVDPHAHEVELADGRTVDYDKLVIATGADMRPDEIPGLAEHAATIWTPQSMLGVRERFERVRDDAQVGRRSRVLFLIPPNNKCAGPLYEIVMMLETWLRSEGVREQVEITWSTFEQSYIQAFGPRLHEVVSTEFEARGIHGHTSEVVTEIIPGEARYADGSARTFDHLIAFPPYVSAVHYEALPSDERGFIQTETTTREVAGHPDVYAPGDAGDFPVKQAFSLSCKPTPSPSTSPRAPAHTPSRRRSTRCRCASWRCSTRPSSRRCRSSSPATLRGRSPFERTPTATTRSAPARSGAWERRCSAPPSRCASTPASPSTPASAGR
jgi:sulfide:quinone oxidoreductase